MPRRAWSSSSPATPARCPSTSGCSSRRSKPTGVDIPYATLDYSWGAGAPAGSIVINTWTGRIRSILVRSGPEGMGEWVTEERNVYEDFKRVFGEEPGRITQVVIYTDTDATGATAEAWYGDIELLLATPAARPSAP